MKSEVIIHTLSFLVYLCNIYLLITNYLHVSSISLIAILFCS